MHTVIPSVTGRQQLGSMKMVVATIAICQTLSSYFLARSLQCQRRVTKNDEFHQSFAKPVWSPVLQVSRRFASHGSRGNLKTGLVTRLTSSTPFTQKNCDVGTFRMKSSCTPAQTCVWTAPSSSMFKSFQRTSERWFGNGVAGVD